MKKGTRQMKFNVGDRVRLTEAVARFQGGELYEAPPRTEGTVMEADGRDDVYGVLLEDMLWERGERSPDRIALSGYHEHELELVKRGGVEMIETQNPTLTIDPEFQKLLPGLARTELQHLEESLMAEGCRDPLIAWGEILVDGHHRYELCTKHGIAFDVAQMGFENKDKAKAWILKNQLARRNLAEYLRTKFALKLRDILEPQVKEQQRERGKQHGRGQSQKTTQPVAQSIGDKEKRTVRGQIAQAAGTSHETVRKVETIEEKGDEETKQQVATGAISISTAYKQAVEGRKAGEPEEEFTAEKIKSVKDARFTALNEAGKSKLLSRKQLLDEHDFTKCKECNGYGITKKESK